MNTRETLILKTLSWKQTLTGSGGGELLDHLLNENQEKADEITKNVCARIPLQLAQEMETLGNMLDLNKREIITMALIDFLDKARDTLTEFKAWPDDVEEASLRAQILCENIMESGEKKLEMVTLKVHTEAFKSWLDIKSAFQLAPL